MKLVKGKGEGEGKESESESESDTPPELGRSKRFLKGLMLEAFM